MNVKIKTLGKCSIYDLTNNQLILDQAQNSIHPLNLSVVLGRGLAGMPNNNCYRMAFGNGGTILASSVYIKKEANTNGFGSRLYNETYSEIIDATSVGLLSTGDGTVPEKDGKHVLFESGPGCRIIIDPSTNTTRVLVTCDINPQEPKGQAQLKDDMGDDSFFEFDEIGLFTKGKSSITTKGYQYVDVDQTPTNSNPQNETSSTGLQVNSASSKYFFRIAVDGGSRRLIKLDFSNLTITPTYSQLITRINNAIRILFGSPVAEASISGPNLNTFGHLKFTSVTSGSGSAVNLNQEMSTDTQGFVPLFSALGGVILPAVGGQSPGVAINTLDSTKESERLLCHLRFTPIKKASNVAYRIVYELELTIEPTQEL